MEDSSINLNSLEKFKKSVSLICWAYNEEILIKKFLERANNLLKCSVEDYEIIVVDDCSIDGTNAIITEMQKEIPEIKLFKNDSNLNVGYSCKKAIRLATKDYLFWQTIDWSYDISQLRLFLELLNTHDIIAGVRRAPVKVKSKFIKPLAILFKLFGVKHITKRSDTIMKAVISIINYSLIRILFKIPLSDFQNVVIYPTKLVQNINMEANSSFINPELLIKSYWLGYKIVEVPISFIPREAGKAKGTKFTAIISSIKDIFTFWWQWIILRKRNVNPNGATIRLNVTEF